MNIFAAATSTAEHVALPLQFEIISMVVLTLILIADVLMIFKRPHIPSAKESTAWVVFYALLAIAFGGIIGWLGNAEAASQFYAGWLTEYSLSVDNLFVFVIKPGRAVYQQHLRAPSPPQRDLPQSDQRLPLRVGRRDLRRLPLRRQHRESQSRFGIGHHSLRARSQATRRADRRSGVSNYGRWLSGDDYTFINMI